MSPRTQMMMVALLTAAAAAVATAASVREPPPAQACSGTVTIELELTYDTVSANDQIPNDTKEICVGDKITWRIHNKSGLDVEVEVDQFHTDKNPKSRPDPIDFDGGKKKSIRNGRTGEIKGKIKEKELPRCIKYYIFLETVDLRTSHDPRLEIIEPPPLKGRKFALQGDACSR